MYFWSYLFGLHRGSSSVGIISIDVHVMLQQHCRCWVWRFLLVWHGFENFCSVYHILTVVRVYVRCDRKIVPFAICWKSAWNLSVSNWPRWNLRLCVDPARFWAVHPEQQLGEDLGKYLIFVFESSNELYRGYVCKAFLRTWRGLWAQEQVLTMTVGTKFHYHSDSDRAYASFSARLCIWTLFRLGAYARTLQLLTAFLTLCVSRLDLRPHVETTMYAFGSALFSWFHRYF